MSKLGESSRELKNGRKNREYLRFFSKALGDSKQKPTETLKNRFPSKFTLLNFLCNFTHEFTFLIPDTDNQRVIIHVKDVNDEPPYFINRPLPMQAVVQLNAPPNTPVFTLQARDPDTDHNIHYFIVRDRTGGR